jgi:hypothetical protein
METPALIYRRATDANAKELDIKNGGFGRHFHFDNIQQPSFFLISPSRL